MSFRSCLLLMAASSVLIANSAHAAFHVMQIEQVIGGVNGNPAAQAIQLRMRSAGQSVVSASSLWAADAAGGNRVLLLDIDEDVTSSASGARVLLTTSSFTSTMVAGGAASFSPDFTLANPIPSSYLNAGRLLFEDDGGSASTPGAIYWSLSWGGASYTGSNTGSTQNDANGNFGPAFGSALPTSSRKGVIFPGAFNALSTTNLADYAFTADPATVTKNSGASFTVVAPNPPGDYNGDGQVNASDYTKWRETFGSTVTASSGADGNGNGTIDAADYVLWRKLVTSGSGAEIGSGLNQSASPVPEPAAIALFTLAVFGIRSRVRRKTND